MGRKKTVLAVVAHADDMEFFAAGTLRRFVELGYDVYEYILTDNGKGSYRLGPRELVAVSAREAVRAGELLGLKEVRLAGYPDAELNLENTSVLRGKVMQYLREVKADILVSWDPFAPYEDHPDHRACAFAALDAASFSGNPLFHPEHDFDPYPVTEAYWFAKSPLNAECFVDISGTIDRKIEALLAHRCQMDLTVDLCALEARVLGLSLPALEEAVAQDPGPLIDAGVRQWNAELGAVKGFAYAEQFRYQRLSALSTFLGLDAVEPDFV